MHGDICRDIVRLMHGDIVRLMCDSVKVDSVVTHEVIVIVVTVELLSE